MNAIESPVRVEVDLSPSVLLKVDEAARLANRTLSAEVAMLVEQGLKQQEQVSDCLRALSEDVRLRLEREGTLQKSEVELWADMRTIRETVANELYPG